MTGPSVFDRSLRRVRGEDDISQKNADPQKCYHAGNNRPKHDCEKVLDFIYASEKIHEV